MIGCERGQGIGLRDSKSPTCTLSQHGYGENKHIVSTRDIAFIRNDAAPLTRWRSVSNLHAKRRRIFRSSSPQSRVTKLGTYERARRRAQFRFHFLSRLTVRPLSTEAALSRTPCIECAHSAPFALEVDRQTDTPTRICQSFCRAARTARSPALPGFSIQPLAWRTARPAALPCQGAR